MILYNKGKNKFDKTLINNSAHGTTLKASKGSVFDPETIEESGEQMCPYGVISEKLKQLPKFYGFSPFLW